MTQPLAGKLILIVEDEAVFRSLLHSLANLTGRDNGTGGDGVEALQKMAESKPDLMICDISMPRMNGLELVEQLRNRGETLPILMISATENMADIAVALRLGVRDVLLKPVKISTACGKRCMPVCIPICSTRGLRKKNGCLRTGTRWLATLPQRQGCCRSFSLPYSKKFRSAVFIIVSWCQRINPVWCSILRHYQKMIWPSIVWMSHEQEIMGCWRRCCCGLCLMDCFRSSWPIRAAPAGNGEPVETG